MLTRPYLALSVVLLMAGCGTPPPGGGSGGPPVPATADDTCGATPYAYLIGQDATALEKVLILRQVRVIRPGDAVTMDFSAERINFDLDGANRIVRIFCG